MKKSHLLLFVLVLISFHSIAQWYPLTSGTTKILHAVYCSNKDTVVVAGQSGIILRTTDGGANWTTQYPVASELYSLSFANADTGYSVGNAGTILKTTDGGISWTQQNSGTTKNLFRVHFLNASLGYIVGASGKILKTTNGGTLWDTLTSGTSNLLQGVFFTDDTTGYVTGANSTILKTTNGISWAPQIDPSPLIWLQHVFFPAPDTGFICDPVSGNPNEPKFLKTTNGGIDWEPYGVGLGSPSASSYFINTNTGYFVGGAIYKTTDGGNTMVLQDSVQYGLNHVWFTDANTGYAVGVHGTILKTTNGGQSQVGIHELQQNNCLKIYPNPTIEQITIELPETLNNSNTSLSINGVDNEELILLEVSGSIMEIDVSSLPPGLYFIKLISNGRNAPMGVGKFIKN